MLTAVRDNLSCFKISCHKLPCKWLPWHWLPCCQRVKKLPPLVVWDDVARTSPVKPKATWWRSSLSEWSVFDFFCLLTGQYISTDTTEKKRPWKSLVKRVPSLVGSILFVCQVFLYLSLAVGDGRAGDLSSYEHTKFIKAITFGSLAAFLFSYGPMICLLLVPVSGILCSLKCEQSKYQKGGFWKPCCDTHHKAFKTGALSLFEDTNAFPKLTSIQTTYFLTNHFLIHIFLFGSFIFSVAYAFSVLHCWSDTLNFLRIIIYSISQLCAVQSCFVFSKIVYKVTNRLEKLATKMNQANFTEQHKMNAVSRMNDPVLRQLVQKGNQEMVDRGRYYWLQTLDNDFIRQVRAPLSLLKVWFVFHISSYALTTILLSAYVLQTIVWFKETTSWFLFFLFFFTLVQVYLFLYPLFRAIAIGAARTKLIKTVSQKQWRNVPYSFHSDFIVYLKTRDFPFKAIFVVQYFSVITPRLLFYFSYLFSYVVVAWRRLVKNLFTFVRYMLFCLLDHCVW